MGSGGKPNLALSILATAIVAIGFQPVRERVQRVANRLVYGKRATPYEVLSEFSERVAETYAADDVLPRMARVLAGGNRGAARRRCGCAAAAELRAAAACPDGRPPARSVPMSDGTLPGIARREPARRGAPPGRRCSARLSVTKRRGEALTPDRGEAASTTSPTRPGSCSRTSGSARTCRRDSTTCAPHVSGWCMPKTMERRRLERNLHDGAQQHLVAMKVKLGLGRDARSARPAKAAATIEQLKGDADEALETLRDLARGIYPPLLADKGLVVALESQARKATVPVRVEADGVGRYAQDIEATVYFCVLEALQNIQKYAKASEALIRVIDDEGTLAFEVADDGMGFDASTVRKGTGLTNMRDRIDAVGGTLEIRSEPGSGTRVCGTMPATVRVVATA